MNCRYKAVLFDLDGTLLDTAPDLRGAANYVLGVYGLGPISDDEARARASDGMRALLLAGIPEKDLGKYNFAEMRALFLLYYRDHIADLTRLFPGTAALIAGLSARGVPWGVVTSKPDALARRVLGKFPELAGAGVIVGGDALPRAKPDPEPLLHACAALGVPPARCVYVGDHVRDVEAGHNAGMPAVLALWGYLEDKSRPEVFGADFAARDFAGLAAILGIDL